jgi:hypothetical protein
LKALNLSTLIACMVTTLLHAQPRSADEVFSVGSLDLPDSALAVGKPCDVDLIGAEGPDLVSGLPAAADECTDPCGALVTRGTVALGAASGRYGGTACLQSGGGPR